MDSISTGRRTSLRSVRPGRAWAIFVTTSMPSTTFSEHRVAPAVLARIVEEAVVLDVDEELRARGMRRAGARHGDVAEVVLEAVLRLVLDRLARRLLVVGLVEAAALDHEAVDHPVEHGAVVVAVLHVLQEVLDGLGRLRIELEADRADVGLDVDLRIGRKRAAGYRGQERMKRCLSFMLLLVGDVPARVLRARRRA